MAWLKAFESLAHSHAQPIPHSEDQRSKCFPNAQVFKKNLHSGYPGDNDFTSQEETTVDSWIPKTLGYRRVAPSCTTAQTCSARTVLLTSAMTSQPAPVHQNKDLNLVLGSN